MLLMDLFYELKLELIKFLDCDSLYECKEIFGMLYFSIDDDLVKYKIGLFKYLDNLSLVNELPEHNFMKLSMKEENINSTTELLIAALVGNSRKIVHYLVENNKVIFNFQSIGNAILLGAPIDNYYLEFWCNNAYKFNTWFSISISFYHIIYVGYLNPSQDNIMYNTSLLDKTCIKIINYLESKKYLNFIDLCMLYSEMEKKNYTSSMNLIKNLLTINIK